MPPASSLLDTPFLSLKLVPTPLAQLLHQIRNACGFLSCGVSYRGSSRGSSLTKNVVGRGASIMPGDRSRPSARVGRPISPTRHRRGSNPPFCPPTHNASAAVLSCRPSTSWLYGSSAEVAQPNFSSFCQPAMLNAYSELRAREHTSFKLRPDSLMVREIYGLIHIFKHKAEMIYLHILLLYTQ